MKPCFSFQAHLSNPTPPPETMFKYTTRAQHCKGVGVGEQTLMVCAYRVSVACIGKHRKCKFVPTLLSLIADRLRSVDGNFH